MYFIFTLRPGGQLNIQHTLGNTDQESKYDSVTTPLSTHSRSSVGGLPTQMAHSADGTSPPPVTKSQQLDISNVKFPIDRNTLGSIDSEIAAEAFREQRGDLLVAVTDPLILANQLYSRKIISRETLDHVKLLTLTPSEKNIELFDAIESAIKRHPGSSFLTLIETFYRQDFPQLCIFAERLKNSYSKSRSYYQIIL